MLFQSKKTKLPTPENALPGRGEPIATSTSHFVLSASLKGPYPQNSQQALFGMGCFWGAERKFWSLGEGIITTAVGYAGGYTPNPTYKEVCTGRTGHNEVVLVVYDPTKITYEVLLQTFWENHDPTQGMRQGNDVGSQYRSGLYWTNEDQKTAALASRTAYQNALEKAGRGTITTEIVAAPEFYFAEADHQQYLAKVPHGYCGLGGTGVSCSIGTSIKAAE
ncbi:MAG: peptide-methionine (S)-S-oxide reductase MsrA [Hyphomicrobiaceae bacterium]